jgi:hypothetical protein
MNGNHGYNVATGKFEDVIAADFVDTTEVNREWHDACSKMSVIQEINYSRNPESI